MRKTYWIADDEKLIYDPKEDRWMIVWRDMILYLDKGEGIDICLDRGLWGPEDLGEVIDEEREEE